MAKLPKLPRPSKKDDDGLAAVFNPDRGPAFSIRFAVVLVLALGGIAWIAYYYVGVRPEGGWLNGAPVAEQEATGPTFMQDLQDWNYLIGFGAIALGLFLSAHPSTPLGRGRGVVVGMLGCFVIGVLWICTYYVTQTSADPIEIPVIYDLAQKNLFVGIGLMAVGFTFATKWE